MHQGGILPFFLSRQEHFPGYGQPSGGNRKGNKWKQDELRISRSSHSGYKAANSDKADFLESIYLPFPQLDTLLLTLSGAWGLVSQIVITYMLLKGWFFIGGDSHSRKLFQDFFLVYGVRHTFGTVTN